MRESTVNPARHDWGSQKPVGEELTLVLERYRCGDMTALQPLLAGLYPLARRFVWKLTGWEEAELREDLVQDCLEQICRSLDGFEGRARLSTYVYGVCFRVVSSQRRRERVRRWFRREAETVTLPGAFQPPDAHTEHRQARLRAEAALQRLSGEERAAFVLFESEGVSIEEVGEALGRSPRTVKRRLQAARAKLLPLRKADR